MDECELLYERVATSLISKDGKHTKSDVIRRVMSHKAVLVVIIAKIILLLF